VDYVAEYLAILRRSNDPRYDVNHDGRVNCADLAIIKSQLGQRCSGLRSHSA
jgi:hypothetical protein